jgi:hypothetical protein
MYLRRMVIIKCGVPGIPRELGVSPELAELEFEFNPFSRVSIFSGLCRLLRVEPGSCLPGAPTDPDERISRIRFLEFTVSLNILNALSSGSVMDTVESMLQTSSMAWYFPGYAD